jgi:hypothetical protein
MMSGLGDPGSNQLYRYVAATDRYVAVMQNSGKLTLIDDQTGTRRVLLAAGQPCRSNYGLPTQLAFGGPFLMLACGNALPVSAPSVYNFGATYALYDLETGRWSALRVASQCLGICEVVGIGRYWAKIVTDEGQSAYGPIDYYLQNLQTGQFVPDPATPNGQTLDDLNAPTGSSPLCPPLRYPGTYTYRDGTTLGALGFYDGFALTTGQWDQIDGSTAALRLRRCSSPLNVVIARGNIEGGDGIGGPGGRYFGITSSNYSFNVVASSRAVLTGPTDQPTGTTPKRLQGWLLPSVHPFTIANPPSPALRHIYVNYLDLAAATRYDVYVTVKNQLWAAPLPKHL